MLSTHEERAGMQLAAGRAAALVLPCRVPVCGFRCSQCFFFAVLRCWLEIPARLHALLFSASLGAAAFLFVF